MGRLILAAACLAAAAGCSRGDDAAAGAGPYASRVRSAVPKVEQAIGLKFKTPPKVESRSRDEVRQFLEAAFNRDLPAAKLAGIERAYKRLGLLPDSLRLRDYMLELLTEQVAGYYDPATKVLYIVEGSPDDMVGVTLTHELVHALQDQYLNLDSLQKADADNDRKTAAQAMIEGQATYEQLSAMSGGGDIAAALPGGWDRMRDMIRDAQSQMPIFASAPLIIQETLIFPYLSGAEFVRRFETRQAAKGPLEDVPTSTEQVMHEDAFFGTRDEPTTITLPAPTGATDVHQDNLGEFETRLFLFQHLQDQAAAVRGAAGWDGDRYMLVETPRGDGLVWATVWDSAVDAAEFRDLLERVIQKRYGANTFRRSGEGTRIFTSGGRTVELTAGSSGDRPMVVMVDLPEGGPAGLAPLGAIRLAP